MSGEEFEEDVRYFAYDETDRRALEALAPLLLENADELVSAFYDHLQGHEQMRQLLADPRVAERLREQQRRYLLSLAGPVIDADYVSDRRRIGSTHERIGLEPRWYVGAYALYLSLLTPLVVARFGAQPERVERTLTALQRLLLFDMQIAMEHYVERRETELRAVNQELARSGRQLARNLEATGVELARSEERARAAERLASIGVLVAGLAHEIGTPMGVIQGHAKLLESDVDGEEAGWRLRTIQEQIGRISRIMQSLLGMARPGKAAARTAVAVGPLLESTLAFLREKLARRSIETELALEDAPSVIGEPERLQQVFLNLLLNASDAMRDGGRLTISLRLEGEGIAVVRIGDTGPGIAKADLPRVFEPFHTTKGAGEGHGLGLSVADGIIAEHAGRLEVESTGPGGTVFRVALPVAEAN